MAFHGKIPQMLTVYFEQVYHLVLYSLISSHWYYPRQCSLYTQIPLLLFLSFWTHCICMVMWYLVFFRLAISLNIMISSFIYVMNFWAGRLNEYSLHIPVLLGMWQCFFRWGNKWFNCLSKTRANAIYFLLNLQKTTMKTYGIHQHYFLQLE
jgi:hypothetical protein